MIYALEAGDGNHFIVAGGDRQEVIDQLNQIAVSYPKFHKDHIVPGVILVTAKSMRAAIIKTREDLNNGRKTVRSEYPDLPIFRIPGPAG